MPDISMCRNIFCPLKDKCYRYRAVISKFRQSFGSFDVDEDGKCDHYFPIQKGDRLVPLPKII